jgi:hypothetical protein
VDPISFVTWKWYTHGSPRLFSSEHVNVLYAMIARHYPREFRMICITDDPLGLDPRIDPLPMPVRFDQVQSPQGARFPNCYCRLWNFSREAVILGERIFALDIDVIITGDLRPLVDRDEDFVGWCDKVSPVPTTREVRRKKHKPVTVDHLPRRHNKIAGGAYLLRTGSMPHVWEDFDPETSPARAFAAGHLGSDQGWMSFKLYPCAGFSDGLLKINWTPPRTRTAPPGARLVFTNSVKPPWNRELQKRYPWIRDHWKL